MFPKSTGTPSVAAPLTWKPAPGVEKITPRGEFTLKKFAARLFGAAEAAGTPSQLISRRTPPNDPFAPAVVPPLRSKRNESRALTRVASFAVAPVADRTTWAEVWSVRRDAKAAESKNRERTVVEMIFSIS